MSAPLSELKRPPADYRAFLAGKRVAAEEGGFEVDAAALPPGLFPWQRQIVLWALRIGKAAIFSECGTGKSAMQLAWAAQVVAHSGRPVLILAPLAVAGQTKREGEKFGIPVTVCRNQDDVRPGVNVANYERLHLFDPTVFGGVVADESGILKSFTGATKQALIRAFRSTPYRLCCTATPAPNDYLELGNHAEFLGVMPSNEMIMRWFINDSMAAGKYRLKGHAERDFWRWVSSWAVSLAKPSDLGYSDEGYILPPLTWAVHSVEVDLTEDAGDALFRAPTLSSTGLHQEKRRTVGERAAKVAELVSTTPGPWICWCDTNYEADAVTALLPEAVEVRGSDSLDEKEARLDAFCRGEARVLVTKPSIAGFGLNLQHCAQQVFVGLSYSFESVYQAVRRSWRFGQERPVAAHVVMAETEGRVLATIREKQAAHETMKGAMVDAMRETQLAGQGRRTLLNYDPRVEMRLPRWLKGERR